MWKSVLASLLIFSTFANINATIPETTSTDISVNCKTFTNSKDCVKLGNKFYLIEPQNKLNWFQADRYCRRHNARLALIQNDEELEAIRSYVNQPSKRVKGNPKYWLGATNFGTGADSVGNFYETESGEQLRYAQWGTTFPDNYGGPEHCLSLMWWPRDNAYIMNDEHCEYLTSFICEYIANAEMFRLGHFNCYI